MQAQPLQRQRAWQQGPADSSNMLKAAVAHCVAKIACEELMACGRVSGAVLCAVAAGQSSKLVGYKVAVRNHTALSMRRCYEPLCFLYDWQVGVYSTYFEGSQKFPLQGNGHTHGS
jgi:hypothetical protein